MTLTALIPSLRRTLPDPLAAHRWPAGTRATTTDVVVVGASMVELARRCGTPCVHLGVAPAPHACGSTDSDTVTVVVVAVRTAARGLDGALLLELDADLHRVHPVWDEARLVGRASTAPAVVTHAVGPGAPRATAAAHLPADVTTGDLVALPCPGSVALHQVLPRSAR